MKIHPDVLAAHAQFGGDLESMQKCYEFDDITQLSTLYSNAIARAEKAEEALSQFSWQPIADAPTDGTNIQAWAEGYDWPIVIRYERYEKSVAETLGADGYWRYSDDNLADIAHAEDEEVTHWQPLPPPPVREKP